MKNEKIDPGRVMLAEETFDGLELLEDDGRFGFSLGSVWVQSGPRPCPDAHRARRYGPLRAGSASRRQGQLP
jgi:hypothetical protein